MTGEQWKDLGYKVFWTMVAGVGGVILTALGDLDAAWAPILIALVNALTIVARKRLGERAVA